MMDCKGASQALAVQVRRAKHTAAASTERDRATPNMKRPPESTKTMQVSPRPKRLVIAGVAQFTKARLPFSRMRRLIMPSGLNWKSRLKNSGIYRRLSVPPICVAAQTMSAQMGTIQRLRHPQQAGSSVQPRTPSTLLPAAFVANRWPEVRSNNAAGSVTTYSSNPLWTKDRARPLDQPLPPRASINTSTKRGPRAVLAQVAISLRLNMKRRCSESGTLSTMTTCRVRSMAASTTDRITRPGQRRPTESAPAPASTSATGSSFNPARAFSTRTRSSLSVTQPKGSSTSSRTSPVVDSTLPTNSFMPETS
mmetsp:Transcript_101577/g.308158  ORF Transcript_101577/g.308158 Transcript_101577/m.308158 type:complete len:309 (+) Transcript_101577:167-1093(+)